MRTYQLLIVDDEKIQRESLKGFLGKKGYQVQIAENGEQGWEIVQNSSIDLVLSDIRMTGMNGYQLLEKIQNYNPSIMMIMMTAFGKIEDAVSAMKAGAFDYLSKPVDLEELEILIKRALTFRQMHSELELLREKLSGKHNLTEIISGSTLMEDALNMVARAATSKATVLLLGESGTGKELFARAIHSSSHRAHAPMITVNCAALAENLLESELFGHEKGAFTGAVRQRVGRFEEANGGTIFLDEVGEIPLTTQVKLLRFLQFGKFERVGGNETIEVDVRLIAATNRDLVKMIRENDFREDFYYRLNVVQIDIPPLRARKQDVPLLTSHFLNKYSKLYEKQIDGISAEALDALMTFPFPGNVRELENMIERAVVLTRDSMISSEDLPAAVSGDTVNPTSAQSSPLDYYSGSFEEQVSAFESDLIQRALEASGGNQSEAARSLQMNERQLRYKMQKYGLKK
jgi:DNA-binding NtrC family response regulator